MEQVAIRTYRLPMSLANDMDNYSRETGLKKDYIAKLAIQEHLISKKALTKNVVK